MAYVDLLTGSLPVSDRLMVATGVVFHHRSLTVSGGFDGLADLYREEADWQAKFGSTSDPRTGRLRVQVPIARHREVLRWLAVELGVEPDQADGRRLWERARDVFAEVQDAWTDPVDAELGLVAVLLQGAVTLADHSGSAHVPLQRHMPLPVRYLQRLPAPYAHQQQAAAVTGHLALLAPTGSGKTEAGLAWASTQLETMPGRPRLV
nr:CRISPR-associated helicase/endonuclease Cas3 [Micromonospora sp. DSM 115978]